MPAQSLCTRRAPGLSANFLKGLACLFMLADHVAAVLVRPLLSGPIVYAQAPAHLLAMDGQGAYFALRYAGRLAFPIFCYFLVEGFLHTRASGRYLLRLGGFALLSEIPFDLAMYGQPFYWRHQNVFFTLLLGLLGLMLLRRLQSSPPAQAVVVLLLPMLAQLLHCDYRLYGVLTIFVIYLLAGSEAGRTLSVSAVLLAGYRLPELTAPLAFGLLHFYDGRRGRGGRWFFYLFYPLHLLALAALRRALWG